MYNSLGELLDLTKNRNCAIWEIVLENEMRLGSCTGDLVLRRLEERYAIMRESAKKALHQPLDMPGGLISGVAQAQYAHAKTERTICGESMNLLMARALSCSEVNASMGKICAAPTAGSCGILPAVLVTVAEIFDLSERTAVEGLLTASGIGQVIMTNATVSGAEGGCQAECGVAASMAAAAAVQMCGGHPEVAMHAAALALIHAMGLICDPIAGLVQTPCAQRNASQAMNAVLSADLALGGMESPIPPDEVVEAMHKVGRMMPIQLKETAQGGIAATKTARAIAKSIFSE